MSHFSMGSRIRAVRGELGVSEFADKLEINRKTVTRWEADEGIPDGDSLILLYQGFGADPLWILLGEGSAPEINSAEQVLLSNYRICSIEAKKNLLQTSSLLAAGVEVSKPVVNTGNKVVQNFNKVGQSYTGDLVIGSPLDSDFFKDDK